MTAKGHRRFLAIMVAIFGGFKAEFSGRGKFYYLPRKQRTPTSGGKLVGVQLCGAEDMRPDLVFSTAKWNPRKNRLPKMPQAAFSVGTRYHEPSEKSQFASRQSFETAKANLFALEVS